jgi:hypothetical protein
MQNSGVKRQALVIFDIDINGFRGRLIIHGDPTWWRQDACVLNFDIAPHPGYVAKCD